MTIGAVYELGSDVTPNTEAQVVHQLNGSAILEGLLPFLEKYKKQLIDAFFATAFHDFGNLVRYDLERHPHLLGEEIIYLPEWRRKQLEAQALYGHCDTRATEQALIKIGFDSDFTGIITGKENPSDDLRHTFSHFSDLHLMGTKIVDPETRLEDINARHGEDPAFVTHSRNVIDKVRELAGGTLPVFSEDAIRARHKDILALEIPKIYFENRMHGIEGDIRTMESPTLPRSLEKY